MDKSMIIEIVGYIGSLLVLVSFLMVSVVKLRIVNSIGSLIFMVYALIIKSYPTAIMNFCLVLINLYYLYKTSRTNEKEYDLTEVDKTDTYLRYLLKQYKDDILLYYPETDFSLKDINKGFIISHDNKPVGITLGKLNKETYELLLDYTIAQYRDFTIGKYLVNQLEKLGIKKLIFAYPSEKHIDYLNRLGYKQEEGKYIKEL